ncbi:MAG: hypothetical protein J5873_01810 [Bacteroidales bacterium]|nr:hypothetical protein [Bacteroidales bacterium]
MPWKYARRRENLIAEAEKAAKDMAAGKKATTANKDEGFRGERESQRLSVGIR